MSATKNINAEKIQGNLSISSISSTTISGGTLYSGSTDLSSIFLTTADGNDITRVQPGNNINTGGTANNPIVNLDDDIYLNSVSATTISGGTFYGDGSNLSGINDFYLTGQTFDNSNYILTSSLNDGSILNADLSVLASDIFVVSGVYTPSTGVVTYTNSSGGTFNVSGFTTGMTDSYTNAANLNGNLIEFDNNIQGSNLYSVDLSPALSAFTTGNTYVTGFTYNNANTFTISRNDDVDISASINTLTGLTVDGVLSATTIDGNTILSGGTNLTTVIESLDTYVTGGTVSVPATDNTNSGSIGLFYKNSDGIPRTLPFEDTFVTGTTFTSNEATLTRNDGVDVLKITGDTNVVLSNPSANQIKLGLDLGIKSGTVRGVDFTGTPLTIKVTFTTPYPDTDYSVNVTGSINRNFTFESKTAASFIISSNSSTSFSDDVDWFTIKYGEQ
jgi:hypothetical protein